MDAEIKVPALTSQEAQDIDALFKSLLSASAREEVEHYESVHGKGNLNFFRYLFGGVEAGYDKTRHLLKNVGRSEDNIKTLVSTIADMADRIPQSSHHQYRQRLFSGR
ncbi:hypothetical protein [Rhizobium ruizarguesonis]|uniref:hypothetical protein n=1 Tax=Rhizobium ruizarguesonis TaxID=2081791 RepID=UPI003720946C